jgi:hypothetical protein
MLTRCRIHIYQDLQPYVCFYTSCPYTAAFEDRNTWADHLGLEHGLALQWQSHPCPLCQEHIGPGRGVISGHLAKHMEEISLAALPRDTESETNSEVKSVASSRSRTGNSTNGGEFPLSDPRLEIANYARGAGNKRKTRYRPAPYTLRCWPYDAATSLGPGPPRQIVSRASTR